MNFVTRTGKLTPLLSGIVWAFIFMAILTVILSFLLWLTDLKEENLKISAYIIHVIALIIGGFQSGRKGEEKGWYNGAMLGTVYAILVMLIGFLAFDASFGWQAIVYVLVAALCGSLGGIVGVNTRK
jgi:putative membrane protein (TIGR04086 family)